MTADPIANYISNLSNAARAGKDTVVFPYSGLKNAISDVLEREGYVKNITKKNKKGPRTIEVKIVYEGEAGVVPGKISGASSGRNVGSKSKPKIHGVTRVSRPSKRIYRNSTHLESVKNGYGRLIVSTSKGILTDKDARKQKLGGEVLFKIW